MAKASRKIDSIPMNGRGFRNATPLAEQAYQEIKRMFMVNQLVAGQKLRYQDIARRLSMSQTPVIQALTRLETEGLVASEANKGFFVPELDLDEARELYEMRVILEGFLIRRAARHVTVEQLRELLGLVEEHRRVRGEIYTRERLWHDAKLHLAIASYSRHQSGLRFLRQIFERLVLRYRPERLSRDRMSGAEQEHRQIYEALCEHDGERAAAILEDHIVKGGEHILDGLEQDERYRSSFSPWD